MENLYVVARSIGGWNQSPMFSGTLDECEDYMMSNPCLGYGSDNTNIIPIDEWEVDYL
jgi:hypothetical protein